MKKLLTVSLTVALVLTLGALAIANDQPLRGDLDNEISFTVTIGPYAHVEALKAEYIGEKWSLFGEWEHWEPLMDFGDFNGTKHQGKAADTNCFILETNTPLQLEFSGSALAHETYKDSRMLTRYWAWQSLGVGDDWKIPIFGKYITVPKEIVPVKPLGHFGPEGKAPEYTENFEEIGTDGWIDFIRNFLKLAFYQLIWPTGYLDEADTVLPVTVDKEGVHAYQVFGFASTDEVSSQRAGNYSAAITLTVSPRDTE